MENDEDPRRISSGRGAGAWAFVRGAGAGPGPYTVMRLLPRKLGLAFLQEGGHAFVLVFGLVKDALDEHLELDAAVERHARRRVQSELG